MREVRNVGDIYRIILGFAKDTKYLNINRTYAGKLRNPFLLDIYVLKTMIYCLNRVSLRKS